MKGKSLFAIIVTIVFALALWSGALGVCFEKTGCSSNSIILKIDKNSKGAVAIQRSFHNISVTIKKLSDTVFSMTGGSSLVQQCKDQPVLFGGLFIFFGVSACGVFFIVHMIRTDSRFN